MEDDEINLLPQMNGKRKKPEPVEESKPQDFMMMPTGQQMMVAPANARQGNKESEGKQNRGNQKPGDRKTGERKPQ